MTIWLTVLALAGVTVVLLRRFARFPRGGMQMLGATLLLACAGYAWQGRPGLPGKPTPAHADPSRPAPDYAALREMMFSHFTGDAQVLDTADAFLRQDLDLYAIGILQSALQRRPNSAELWVGLGNALVAHNDGLVLPAAELAFRRAAAASPLHPGPPYFLGLAYARSLRVADARAQFAPLLARTPANAPWRAALIAQLAELDDVEAMLRDRGVTAAP